VWRRRWLLVVPLVVSSIGTMVWSRGLPDRYRSEAVVLVVPPRVPQNYVRPTVTKPLKDRLEGIRQEILSRTRLERIITEFDLYPELRRKALMDTVVARMRDDIGLEVAAARTRRADPNSFTVSYESGNPKTAVLVADRLASLFVQANIENRAVQTNATTQFLQSQLDEARRKLQEHEATLESFRRSHAGRLPSEVESNLHVMTNTQEQVQALNIAISQDRDRQVVIERTIADELSFASVPVAGPVPRESGQVVSQPAAQELLTARANLAALELKLKPEHPDVRNLKKRIRELEQRASDEALAQPVSEGGASNLPVSAADLARQKRIAGLRAELDSIDRRIATRRQQVEQLQGVIADYQARVQAAPTLETQLTQLTRDYDTIRATYTSLLLKSQDARLSANMEESEVGEQFRIVDSARLPEVPASPDRFTLNAIGAVAGLFVGLAWAALVEYRDRSLRTEDDVVTTLSLPVLALVPTMVTRIERLKRKRRRFLLASSGAAFALVCLAVIAWKLQILTPWMR
jgi:polysaccharide chain length determinant protein (PEP-CTERM system associated)